MWHFEEKYSCSEFWLKIPKTWNLDSKLVGRWSLWGGGGGLDRVGEGGLDGGGGLHPIIRFVQCGFWTDDYPHDPTGPLKNGRHRRRTIDTAVMCFLYNPPGFCYLLPRFIPLQYLLYLYYWQKFLKWSLVQTSILFKTKNFSSYSLNILKNN